jgi:hypothetical protein
VILFFCCILLLFFYVLWSKDIVTIAWFLVFFIKW